MISGKTQNPIPPNKTDEELANEFANHFLYKIEKIDQNSPPLGHTHLRLIILQHYEDLLHSLKTNYAR